MRFDEAYSGNVFIKSHPNYDEAQAVIYGMPMDWTVSYRPGSRFGPHVFAKYQSVLKNTARIWTVNLMK